MPLAAVRQRLRSWHVPSALIRIGVPYVGAPMWLSSTCALSTPCRLNPLLQHASVYRMQYGTQIRPRAAEVALRRQCQQDECAVVRPPLGHMSLLPRARLHLRLCH